MITKTPISFEFFPPQTAEGLTKLTATCSQLAELKPEYFSVTFGAGGSTRDRTLTTVEQILGQGYTAAPHLSCVGSTRENIRGILQIYEQLGVKRIVALRGDLPSGMASAGEFHYASELVSFVRAETGGRFAIEVAAYPEVHPQAKSAQDDLLNFKRKMDAGANSAITQLFYNADAYFHFVDACRKLGRHPAYRARHHAHREVLTGSALFGCVRRGSAALDAQDAGRLWRRQRIGPGFCA